MPNRTLSPETRTTVTMIDSPSFIRSACFRESTSIIQPPCMKKTNTWSYDVDRNFAGSFPFANAKSFGILMQRKTSPCHGLNYLQIVGDHGRLHQLRAMEPFPRRTVKQNRIAVRFPNGCILDASRPVQAKVDPTRLSVPHQDSLCH